MYNVVCLKHGIKFDADYVNKLFYAVKRNTTVPFTFHCFTDNDNGINPNIEIHPLPYIDIKGWWQKIYLFSNELPFTGRFLFIDLDTLIIDNIDHYLTHDEGLVVLRDLWYGKDNVGSALLSLEVGKHVHIWEDFKSNYQSIINSLHPHGDQKWIQQTADRRICWQDLFPSEIYSFKLQCLKGLPPTSRIVCFHGPPSIPEAISTTTRTQGFNIPPTKWITEYWIDE